ncbi:POU domain class 4 transcription factor 1 [Drosophila madeirensis]|uniref:POU domain class 4 transcription factor 1 n=1 Tax=Drosophila madeirensis TaxID=30013 RepID=A0AAU9G1U2_DROMD
MFSIRCVGPVLVAMLLALLMGMAVAKQDTAARQFGGQNGFGNGLGPGIGPGPGLGPGPGSIPPWGPPQQPGGGGGGGGGGCPLCDSSVYSYCSHKMVHDSCCCDFPASAPQLRPPQCSYYDCSLLYAKSCYEHALIKNCCCNNPY